ncbi:MAG: type VI secretion system contractile sheath large subunit [Pseudomonadota bacterium]
MKFGSLSAPRPEGPEAARRKFRIAVLGDFSARATRSALESGNRLAARRAMKLDVDTLDDVISSFAAVLTLKLGTSGEAIEVPLASLDDLHPDALYENVSAFEALASLRRRVEAGQGIEDMAEWGRLTGAAPTAEPAEREDGPGTAVPTGRRHETFADLLGEPNQAPYPSDVNAFIRAVVAPHVVAAPDPSQPAMLAAVDDAIGGLMRDILHHPAFQAVESQWRSLELIARRVETDEDLELVVYDLAAEELAADLAAHDALEQSAFFRLIATRPMEDAHQGRFGAVIGLYKWAQTPPHGEILGRIARVAAHIEAPFISAIEGIALTTPAEERHPLVAAACAELSALPEARYLGLIAPRFLLRRPYGRKSDPIDRFAFEELTPDATVGALLWGNPAIIAGALIGISAQDGWQDMSLGGVLSLGDMPYAWLTDAYGDPAALPCTAIPLSQRRAEAALARGFMPLVSVRGRDVVRLAGFRAVGGGEILGPWSSETILPSAGRPPNGHVTDTSEQELLSDADQAALDRLLAEHRAARLAGEGRPLTALLQEPD